MNRQSELCIGEDRLLDHLRGALPDSETHQIQSHLSTCSSCCRSLETLAAEPETWSDARHFLGNDPWRESLSRIAETKTVSTVDRNTLVQQVLESLAPTDDPHMLGRIGVYEVSGVIGSGRMGIVLKGHDKSLERIVAIKVLSPAFATCGTSRKRFAREAKAAAAVVHPNVIAIYGVAGDHSLPHLVMPYVRGLTLQKRVDRDGPLPLTDILRIGIQVSAGLAAAHRQGLIHRDIKPANILLEDGVERVTIADFGLARAVDDASVTQAGLIAGTPEYMSPEQANGLRLDYRSDLFSLGSVLYFLATGVVPFRAENSIGVLRKISDCNAKPIREINSEIPRWFEGLVQRLHQRSPEDRYQSGDEVMSLLQQCLAHVSSTDSPLPSSLANDRWSLKGVAMLSFVLVVIAGLMIWSWNVDGPAATESRATQSATTFDSPSKHGPTDFSWESESESEPEQILDEATQLDLNADSPFEPGI